MRQCSAPASEWRLLLPALLTAASAAAARVWLGYTPPELQASADAALARLQRGATFPLLHTFTYAQCKSSVCYSVVCIQVHCISPSVKTPEQCVSASDPCREW